jgi:hypothetical protein
MNGKTSPLSSELAQAILANKPEAGKVLALIVAEATAELSRIRLVRARMSEGLFTSRFHQRPMSARRCPIHSRRSPNLNATSAERFPDVKPRSAHSEQ